MKKYSNHYFINLIWDKLDEANCEVIKIEGTEVEALFGGIPFKVSFEICPCHGGRLTISSDHIRFYCRLEYPYYREELGITNPETELEYEIQNEMLPIIMDIKNYIYCCKIKTRYSDSWDYCYFNSIESLTNKIINDDDKVQLKDIFKLQDPLEITFPNPDVKEVLIPTKYEDGIKYLIKERFTRKTSNDEWVKDDRVENFEVYIFNKLPKIED